MDKLEMQLMRAAGCTYQKIATRAGISRQRVHQRITGYMSPSSRDKISIRRRLKVEVLTFYGNGKLACVKCGFEDIRALSIDHINGGGYQHRKEIGGRNVYSWLKEQHYPKGYRTLCMNCQFIERFLLTI